MVTLVELLAQLQRAKAEEAAAKAKRIDVELAIAKAVPNPPQAGQRTIDAENGLKVTVKFGINFKADVEAIRGLDVPTEVGLPLKLKPATWEFDEKAYESLRDSDPKVFALISRHVTTSPAKPSVTVKM